jgi:hypothetical protein
MPILGVVEVHLDAPITKKRPDEMDPGLLELTRHRVGTPMATATQSYSTAVYVTVPGFFAAFGEHAASNLVAADSGDEVMAALSFAALSSCGNVDSQVVPAPPALNKKRSASGKTPFFDTRVLMVADGGYAHGSAVGADGHGTHASPRAHLRRGHVRRLEGGNVWVNAAVVNHHRALETEVPAPRYALERSG